ncbi:MAG: c-type cytochrome [Planctomycetes bacterium]|nr:c-type cytochrome [Planctomycetota bacterium]
MNRRERRTVVMPEERFRMLLAALLFIVPALGCAQPVRRKPESKPPYTAAGETTPKAYARAAAARGEELYRRAQCGVCHGDKAEGGRRNPNSVQDTIVAQDNMAERLFLTYREDFEAAIWMIGRTGTLEAEYLDVPRAPAVVEQYRNTVKIILDGSTTGKKDAARRRAPINMPYWRDELSMQEINEIIIWLLSLGVEEDGA